tara:strand:+ start:36 stop:704 length:669 start_codon:yes stop_codon:yes gene_type:complete
MSLQTIVDNATYVTIYRKKIAGQSISRSGRLLTSEVVSAVPYQFTSGMHSGLQYSTNRGLTEELNALDVTEESTINIGTSNIGLAYITKYLGDLTVNNQPGNAVVISATGTSLVLNTVGVVGTGMLFRKGDYIQLSGAYRYPYQVTADVFMASGAITATVPLSRPFIPQDGYTTVGAGIVYGSAVSWRVKMINKPRYSVLPGDVLQFDDKFEFIEYIRKEDG